MKTSKIKIRSLFGISEQEIGGKSVELTGQKGTGKTSVLDAIRYALTNSSQRDWIIRAAERNEKMWPDYHPLNFADEWTYVRSTQEMYGALIDQINWMDQKLAEGDFSDWWDNK